MSQSEMILLSISCTAILVASVVFLAAVHVDKTPQDMWIVKNNITSLYFAGFAGDEPQFTKHEEQARTYAQWGDAAQICSFLSGHWTPEPITSKI